MAKLIYTAMTTLDGYIEDAQGSFAWGLPEPELHGYINDLERPVGTYLYGRRIYETMAVWQTFDPLTDPAAGPDLATQEMAEYGRIWRAAEKVVFSTTLESVTTPRTRLERAFDPDAIRALKESSPTDLSVSGAGLAAAAFAAGLVDECRLFPHPIAVGGGKPALPLGQRIELTLLAEHRFRSGVVALHYAVRN